MPVFEIKTRGTVEESYWATADTAEGARRQFENGDITVAHRSEVDNCEIVTISLADG